MKTTFLRITDWLSWISKNNRWVIAILLLLTVFAVVSSSMVKSHNRIQPVKTRPAEPGFSHIYLTPAAY